MSEKTVEFKDSALYPILFMVAVSIVFVGILASAYRLSEEKIARNDTREYQIQLLRLFEEPLQEIAGLDYRDLIGEADLEQNFEKYFQEFKLEEIDRIGYKFMIEGNVWGYCFDIAGNGLWGSMRALIAVRPDLSQIIAFAVYKQMETPGLGARIEEASFRNQFIGKALFEKGEIVAFNLISEEQEATADNQIRQITGATITSRSVLDMIHTEMKLIKSVFEVAS
jgi:Na+-transporting NADH:ubiquinone oxidoreductase subunit C